jgi:hypothetical protein
VEVGLKSTSGMGLPIYIPRYKVTLIKKDNQIFLMYKDQSWAHRSYKLSEGSKAMSDLWFSEWKKMNVCRAMSEFSKKRVCASLKAIARFKRACKHFEQFALWAM